MNEFACSMNRQRDSALSSEWTVMDWSVTCYWVQSKATSQPSPFTVVQVEMEGEWMGDRMITIKEQDTLQKTWQTLYVLQFPGLTNCPCKDQSIISLLLTCVETLGKLQTRQESDMISIIWQFTFSLCRCVTSMLPLTGCSPPIPDRLNTQDLSPFAQLGKCN